MTLALPKQLDDGFGNTYTLERELGGGGMSRVFLARDAKLDRQLVVKLLAPDQSMGVSIERFKREIALAAHLQHPHIVPLHGAGEVDGMPFYVMPFITGQSLRARLQEHGELPIPEAIGIVRDVAKALAYAHSHQVVHRDIKPENILLAGDSAVVTDFGVAKALRAAGTGDGTGDGAQSTLTAAGISLGTPAYMAPEQAAADPSTDQRADIYSLGVVAFEMLTGSAPFLARTSRELMAAHAAEAPPDISVKRAAIPPALAQLVMRCLEKRPADRPQNASEVLRELDALGIGAVTSGPHTRTMAASGAPVTRGRRVAWLAAGAVMIVVAALAGRLSAPHPPRVATYSSLLPPAGSAFLTHRGFVLSPDGARLAFIADSGTHESLIWVMRFDDTPPQAIPGTDGALSPFWSPDGEFIAYWHTTRNSLRKASINGVSTAAVCSCLGGDGTWGVDGQIVYSDGGALLKVPASGGTPTTIVPSTVNAGAPEFLPDGRHLLFIKSAGDSSSLFVTDVDGAQPTLLRKAVRRAVPTRSGMLVMWYSGTLTAQRLNLGKLVLEGAAVTLPGTVGAGTSQRGSYTASASRLVRWVGFDIGPRIWVDRSGRVIDTAFSRAGFNNWFFRLSHDQRQLAVTGDKTWLFDVGRKVFTFLPLGQSRPSSFAVWSPRDTALAFYQRGDVRIASLTHPDAPDRLAYHADSGNVAAFDWSSDGRTLILGNARTNPVRAILAFPVRMNILALDVVSARARVVVTGSPTAEWAKLSADGRWLAYESDETGVNEVYVRPLTGGPAVRVSKVGGRFPEWRGDGGELFYVATGGRMMAVDFNGIGSAPVIGTPHLLFRIPVTGVLRGGIHPYVVTVDGQRFLLEPMADDMQSRMFTLVDNWDAEFEGLAKKR